MRSEGDRADLRSGQLTTWHDPFHYLKTKEIVCGMRDQAFCQLNTQTRGLTGTAAYIKKRLTFTPDMEDQQQQDGKLLNVAEAARPGDCSHKK